MKIKMKTAKISTYDIQEIICNPIYAGLGGFPKVISDLEWIKAAKIAIETDGEYHFLIKLSVSLERSFDIQLIGKEEWIKEIEALLQKYDVEKVLVDLLDFLRAFFKREVVNKYIGKYYKNWRITIPIGIVIIQNINILSTVLYIKVWKSSKSGFLNPPILEIEVFVYRQYFCILKMG